MRLHKRRHGGIGPSGNPRVASSICLDPPNIQISRPALCLRFFPYQQIIFVPLAAVACLAPSVGCRS